MIAAALNCEVILAFAVVGAVMFSLGLFHGKGRYLLEGGTFPAVSYSRRVSVIITVVNEKSCAIRNSREGNCPSKFSGRLPKKGLFEIALTALAYLRLKSCR